MQNLTVKEGGLRLDKRLSSHLDFSRNFFHHIIGRGGIQRKHNGQMVALKKSYKVKQGDIIYIDDLHRFLDGGILEEAKRIPIPIIHETPDYLVINKPKGVLSHPNSIRDVKNPSVVARAYHHYKEKLPTMGNFIRAGLVHRLDKGTDGLMILAKSEAGLAHFKKLFQKKSTAENIEQKEKVGLKKSYRAHCDITPEGQEFLDAMQDQVINDKQPHYIIADVIPSVPFPVVKEGITKIVGVNYHSQQDTELSNQVTLYCEILTGRTHQIRYHLSSNGLPIIGDYLYHPDYQDHSSEEKLQLTSYKLEFEDLTGELMKFDISQ